MERLIDDRTRAVLAVASREVPAREANQAIHEEREAQLAVHGVAAAYEVLLRPEHGFAHLCDHVLPRLAHHLGAKRIRTPRAPGAFVALFIDERLYFLDAGAFIHAVAEQAGWSAPQLSANLARWQKEIP